MLRRLANLFKRSAPVAQSKASAGDYPEVIFKNGQNEHSFKKVKRCIIEMEDGSNFNYNPGHLQIKNEILETKMVTPIAPVEKGKDFMDNIKNFNETGNALAKFGAGAAIAGSILITNSERENGEIQKVASAKAENIFDSEII